MSNRYEQSMREQAERIRRELAVQKKPKSEPIERPNKEAQEERFVATDVPSPIYGFQRPRTKAEMESRTADLNKSRSLQAEEVSPASSMGKVEKHETQSDQNEGLGAIETGDIPVSFAKADSAERSVEETLPPELEMQEDLLEDGLDLLEDVQVTEAFEVTEEIEEAPGIETDSGIPEAEAQAQVEVADEVEEGYVPATDLDQLIPDAPEQEQYDLETEDEELPATDLDLSEVEAPAQIEVTDEVEEGYVPATDLDQLVPDAPENDLETEDEEAPETDLDLPEVEAPARIEVTDEVEEGYVPATDLDQLIPDAPENDLETEDEEVPETDHDLPEVGATGHERLMTQEMEEIGEVTTSDEGSSDEGITVRDEVLEEIVLAPAVSAIKKPTGPPVNVIMTTKDLMAMYRTRREQNNLHGKK